MAAKRSGSKRCGSLEPVERGPPAKKLRSADEEERRASLMSPGVSKVGKLNGLRGGRSQEKPAELFRKDLISAMKLPDTEPLQPDDYFLIQDAWRQEWEKGVQVPVNPDNIPVEHVVAVRSDDSLYGPYPFKLPKKLLHSAKDEQFEQALHELHEQQKLAEQVCRYDLDDMDVLWLDSFNDLLESWGQEPITEYTMEKCIEEIEAQCHEEMKVKIKTVEGLGIEYDENVVCDVCRSPDSEDGNEMVFCDNCDICVHQACYGVQTIPEGSWLCRPCALGLRPQCILCPKIGGAMKSTKSGSKWAHVSCALWIPEVSIGCAEKMEPITKISHIPSSRWSLCCCICRERSGACIQCSVKTCKTALHVTCAFQNNLEMRTILEDDNAEIQLKAYCPKHTRKIRNEGGMSPRKSDQMSPISSPKKPEDMTEEEKTELRSHRLKKLEEEFYTCVEPEKVAKALELPNDVADFIYNYWVLKRKSNFNKPLLTPKQEEEDLLLKQQEDSLLARMKMFVHLRQDLERVRNLCYMVNKREKMSRSLNNMKETIFLKQLAYLESEQQKPCGTREFSFVATAHKSTGFYDAYDDILRMARQLDPEVMKDPITHDLEHIKARPGRPRKESLVLSLEDKLNDAEDDEDDDKTELADSHTDVDDNSVTRDSETCALEVDNASASEIENCTKEDISLTTETDNSVAKAAENCAMEVEKVEKPFTMEAEKPITRLKEEKLVEKTVQPDKADKNHRDKCPEVRRPGRPRKHPVEDSAKGTLSSRRQTVEKTTDLEKVRLETPLIGHKTSEDSETTGITGVELSNSFKTKPRKRTESEASQSKSELDLPSDNQRRHLRSDDSSDLPDTRSLRSGGSSVCESKQEEHIDVVNIEESVKSEPCDNDTTDSESVASESSVRQSRNLRYRASPEAKRTDPLDVRSKHKSVSESHRHFHVSPRRDESPKLERRVAAVLLTRTPSLRPGTKSWSVSTSPRLEAKAKAGIVIKRELNGYTSSLSESDEHRSSKNSRRTRGSDKKSSEDSKQSPKSADTAPKLESATDESTDSSPVAKVMVPAKAKELNEGRRLRTRVSLSKENCKNGVKGPRMFPPSQLIVSTSMKEKVQNRLNRVNRPHSPVNDLEELAQKKITSFFNKVDCSRLSQQATTPRSKECKGKCGGDVSPGKQQVRRGAAIHSPRNRHSDLSQTRHTPERRSLRHRHESDVDSDVSNHMFEQVDGEISVRSSRSTTPESSLRGSKHELDFSQSVKQQLDKNLRHHRARHSVTPSEVSEDSIDILDSEEESVGDPLHNTRSRTDNSDLSSNESESSTRFNSHKHVDQWRQRRYSSSRNLASPRS